MSITDRAATILARAVERSATLRTTLHRLAIPGRGRIVARLRGDRLPAAEIVAENDGIRYRVSLQDDVQREIYFGVYERRDIGAIADLVRPGDTCLDVGANVGFYSLHFARWVGQAGRVHAFEPDPQVRARLERNVALNESARNVRVHGVAVSDRAGTAEFYGSDSSHSGWGSLVQFGDIARRTTTVPLITLDAFLEAEKLEHVGLMKVDVEANELELLDGGQSALSRGAFRAILIEFNGVRLAERGRDLTEFLGAFARHRYLPSRINLSVLDDVKAKRVRPESLCVNFLFVRD